MFTDAHRKKAAEARRVNAQLRAQGKLSPTLASIKRKNGTEHAAAAAFTPAPQIVGVTPSFELVTPAKAEKWLNSNKGNRKLRAGVVEKYAKDMAGGQWTTCTAPISFYADGDIADGQHRLWAIVDSNCAQRFLILRGLDRAAGLNIDMGINRTLVDNAHISGVDTGLTNNMISLCRGIAEGGRSSKYLTNTVKLEYVARHRDAANYVFKNGARGRVFNNAIINGAIARAWYHEEDKERLAHFGQVLSKGFADGDQDTAAIALRNFLLTRGATVRGTDWRDVFLKVQNAIWHFMRKRRLMVIKAIADERYPLKGE